MATDSMDTKDKILLAAIDRFAERGFRSVTTKEIANAASVSEMTVFRHFGTKKNILDYAIDQSSHDSPMQTFFKEKIVWDLETDLLMFSREYRRHIKKNEKVFRVFMHEIRNFPDLEQKMLYKNPHQLKKLLADYFSRMQEKGKLLQTEPEAPAIAVVFLNMVGVIGVEEMFSDIKDEDFIKDAIRIFARGLTP
ncbi:TetR/AcrR family transcriptional regulator [Paludifilum halophilum]|uniref:HTH tetR-type domain-containing protein n=1 Tax=Paludifilum halophilum TaxID=1642702 RepID=A0A235B1V2_9BACL|nr:TetR/AcrR family transcriptional regulator [Paludifilum halophilum]OYD06263.1 hypothetical protein CHM34_17005 [Paludifilum halophilum]